MENLTIEKIKNLEQKSLQELNTVDSAVSLKAFENKYLLSKTAEIPNIFLVIASLDKESKKIFGSAINSWRNNLLAKIKKIRFQLVSKSSNERTIEFSLEGKKVRVASFHPVSKMIEEIYGFFNSQGYQVFESSEIDSKWYNFSSLNIDSQHPSRSEHDTFYLTKDLLLRTHTSSCQVRVLEQNKNKEIKIVSAGKVYRRDDDDATHSHQYTNCEVIAVGTTITLTDLKGTLELFFEAIFEQKTEVRLRPSFFPFTEPSFEVDCLCICKGKNSECPVCKGNSWVEILGAGLIHPVVLKNSGYDAEKFTGFALGMGVERIVMIKYGITDIRDLYSNNLRFLKQTRWN